MAPGPAGRRHLASRSSPARWPRSTALVRVLFSLARDGVAPARARPHPPRYRTPHVAIAVARARSSAAVLVVGIARRVPRRRRCSAALLAVATRGFLVAYLLVCLAAPRVPAPHRRAHRPAVVVIAVHRAGPGARRSVAFVVSTRAPAAVVLGGPARRRRRGLVRAGCAAPPGRASPAIGVYDETTAADVLGRGDATG